MLGRTVFLLIFSSLLVGACSSEAPGQAGDVDPSLDPGLLPAAGYGENRVIGTIEATIDGSARTWYVLEANVDGMTELSAFWYEPEPGKLQAMITGYDTPDVSFENAGGRTAPLGEYDGSGMTLVIAFQPRESSKSVRLPGEERTNVLYMPVMTGGEGSSLFQFVDGRLEIEALSAPRSGTGELRGTFHGAMRDLFGSDQSLVVTDGRFEVEELTYRDELSDGGRPR